MTDYMPKFGERIADPQGRITPSWRDYLRRFAAATSLDDVWAAIAEIRAQLAEEGAGSFLPSTTRVTGLKSVRTDGTLSNGVVLVQLQGDAQAPDPTHYYGTDATGAKSFHAVSDTMEAAAGELTKIVDAGGVTTFGLADVADSGAGALLAITRDQYGRVEGTKDATITGTAGQIEVANGDAVAGLPTISLADVADAGGGALQRTAFDAKGRKTGTSAATTDDLAEGASNLYFTNARADARIAAAKADPDGIASLIGGKLDTGQLPALAITETFVVNSEAAMLALDAQQGDVAVRSDEQKSYILTAAPASTLSNWQELLVPTGVGVASFNGRTGSVVPASGDYTAAMVGAATAAQGALADTAIQPGNAALSDAREWTASTVSQAEAEAGSATTRRAWTAQRVRQAIVAWWNGSAAKTKLDGIETGATVGADWASSLINIPANIAAWAGIAAASKMDVASTSATDFDSCVAGNLAYFSIPANATNGPPNQNSNTGVVMYMHTAANAGVQVFFNRASAGSSFAEEVWLRHRTGTSTFLSWQRLHPISEPNRVINGDFALDSTAVGCAVGKNNSTPNIITIPSTIFQAGDRVKIRNANSSGDTAIVRGAGLFMFVNGGTLSADASLAPRGYAIVEFTAANVCYCTGVGVS